MTIRKFCFNAGRRWKVILQMNDKRLLHTKIAKICICLHCLFFCVKLNDSRSRHSITNTTLCVIVWNSNCNGFKKWLQYAKLKWTYVIVICLNFDDLFNKIVLAWSLKLTKSYLEHVSGLCSSLKRSDASK